ncbi:MAG: right-handed parallel beta-helix repeat-containing protein [Actinomycetota bacterium]|nr:right-handed parallel beta-helix repeat-containing protein [Actinomycetota bacterium]
MIQGASEEWPGEFYDRGGAGFNVRHPDFGAVGDGVANDTAAIQAAIAAAPAGATLLFPPGTYLCGALTCAKRLNFEGHGATIQATGVDGATVLSLTAGADRSRLRALTFAGNASVVWNGPTGKATPRFINVFQAHGVEIRGCTFGRYGRQAVNVVECNDIVISDNAFDWQGSYGSDVAGDANAVISVYNSNRPQIIGNRITKSDTTENHIRGIYCLATDAPQIVGNRLMAPVSVTRQTGTVIGVWAGVGFRKNGAAVLGNIILGGYGSQIYIGNEHVGAVVSDNVVRDFNAAAGAAGIFIYNLSHNAVVSGNVVTGGYNSADGILLLTGGNGNPLRCVITGNIVRDMDRNGISVASDDSVVAGNLVEDVDTRAIWISGALNRVFGNSIPYNAAAVGHLVDDGVGTITSGTVARNDGGQVVLSGADVSATVTFPNGELDTSYRVQLTPTAVAGSPPVVATQIYRLSKTTSGFTAYFGGAPGAGNSVTFDYEISR